MSKINHQVVENGFVVGARNSERTYSHAIVLTDVRPGKELAPVVMSFCGNYELAKKALAGAQDYRDYKNARIVPVTVK